MTEVPRFEDVVASMASPRPPLSADQQQWALTLLRTLAGGEPGSAAELAGHPTPNTCHPNSRQTRFRITGDNVTELSHPGFHAPERHPPGTFVLPLEDAEALAEV